MDTPLILSGARPDVKIPVQVDDGPVYKLHVIGDPPIDTLTLAREWMQAEDRYPGACDVIRAACPEAVDEVLDSLSRRGAIVLALAIHSYWRRGVKVWEVADPSADVEELDADPKARG